MNKFIKIEVAEGFDMYVRIDSIQHFQHQQWIQHNLKTEQDELCHSYGIELNDNTSFSVSKEEFEKILQNIEIIS